MGVFVVFFPRKFFFSSKFFCSFFFVNSLRKEYSPAHCTVQHSTQSAMKICRKDKYTTGDSVLINTAGLLYNSIVQWPFCFFSSALFSCIFFLSFFHILSLCLFFPSFAAVYLDNDDDEDMIHNIINRQ